MGASVVVFVEYSPSISRGNLFSFNEELWPLD